MTAAGAKRWFFDGWSLIYDFEPVQRAAYRPVHDAVLRALRQLRPRRVLDVGCGTGLLAARLRRELHAATVVGCDFSAGMLRHAHARRTHVAWVQGDACRLPLSASSFDAVTSTEAFHWFPDQDAALREFRRVLVPGGRLLLGLVNPRSRLLSRLAYAGSRLAGQPFYWPTRAEMRRRIEAAGFAVERQESILRLPGFLAIPPVLTQARRA
jgi:ubiquinone/menaquinone biosynthesis C-methylase UbiE